MNAHTIPPCHQMMVRQITPRGTMTVVGGVLVLDDYDVEDVGRVDHRLPFDTDVVDCSHRIFEITTAMMVNPVLMKAWTVFPSRRWRNFRTDDYIDALPSVVAPLLYLGNPVRITVDEAGAIVVHRLPEFLIKSGMELGY